MKAVAKGYVSFFREIKSRVRQGQYHALKKVNTELIDLYWDIGKMIVDRQNKFGWGKSIVENLALDLQNEFPGIGGFSTANLWRTRTFYLTYKDSNLAPAVRDLSWSHNIAIMEKCKNDSEREFYISFAKRFGWTKNILIHQIANDSYTKYLTNQTNFDATLPEKYRSQAKFTVKDEYAFDFLELSEAHTEYDLEVKLINHIRNFLTEMGGFFTFIGNQYRIEVEGEEFFIDLLLFHRQLKCLVAIDLKIGKFIPEHAGKMQFYLNVLNDKVKLPDENPSIGMILCKDKKRTIVEYALKDQKQPIGVSTYITSKKLPSEVRAFLPKPREIIKSLEKINDLKLEEELLE